MKRCGLGVSIFQLAKNNLGLPLGADGEIIRPVSISRIAIIKRGTSLNKYNKPNGLLLSSQN